MRKTEFPTQDSDSRPKPETNLVESNTRDLVASAQPWKPNLHLGPTQKTQSAPRPNPSVTTQNHNQELTREPANDPQTEI